MAGPTIHRCSGRVKTGAPCGKEALPGCCLLVSKSPGSVDQAARASTARFRRIWKPIPPKPTSIIAHVAGSGTTLD